MKNLNIKIVGLGDGGARAIGKMIAAGVGKGKGVEFIAIGNDENIMLTSSARKNIFLNRDLTTIYKSVTDALDGTKLIFIVGGLGSNAARSAVPIILSRAKNFGAMTVAFVCRAMPNTPLPICADRSIHCSACPSKNSLSSESSSRKFQSPRFSTLRTIFFVKASKFSWTCLPKVIRVLRCFGGAMRRSVTAYRPLRSMRFKPPRISRRLRKMTLPTPKEFLCG